MTSFKDRPLLSNYGPYAGQHIMDQLTQAGPNPKQSLAASFSRSQSRVKQGKFGQYKNVVNLNGQMETGFHGRAQPSGPIGGKITNGASVLAKTTPASTLAQNIRRRPVDDDVPPPPISQNHYRHIHEQRDFTMENLSMAGETELMDYEEETIRHEEEW